MMPRFTVKISEEELSALKASAAEDLRDFRDQARIFIKLELERRGLLLPVNEEIERVDHGE
jgi:hypothetical protein